MHFICICIQMCVLMNSCKLWVSAEQIMLTSTTLCFLKIWFISPHLPISQCLYMCACSYVFVLYCCLQYLYFAGTGFMFSALGKLFLFVNVNSSFNEKSVKLIFTLDSVPNCWGGGGGGGG